ncbi:MAG TPA: hypothetical protein VFW95_03515 [Candidatus Limnocylindria bacterium]|nr:hypothetical protein [Candidatus Limnocylindria bacterium]
METAGGLYWIAPAAVWGIVIGVADGWVLMIEVRRWGPSPASEP